MAEQAVLSADVLVGPPLESERRFARAPGYTLDAHRRHTRQQMTQCVPSACSGVWYEGSAGSGCIGDFGYIRSGMAPGALYTHLVLASATGMHLLTGMHLFHTPFPYVPTILACTC